MIYCSHLICYIIYWHDYIIEQQRVDLVYTGLLDCLYVGHTKSRRIARVPRPAPFYLTLMREFQGNLMSGNSGCRKNILMT